VVVVTGFEASPGFLLGHRYQLVSRIAAGGMGEVWRARDLVLDRPVAVKLLRYGYAAEGVELARFRAVTPHRSTNSCFLSVARKSGRNSAIASSLKRK